MTPSDSYLLVSHGSRDRRNQIALERLAELVKLKLEAKMLVNSSHDDTPIITQMPLPLVGTANLELAPVPLHQSILTFSEQVQAAGSKRIKIFPLFLLPGVHVRKDIPEQLQIAQQKQSNQVNLKLLTYLGSHPGLIPILQEKFSQMKASGRILLCHGSRRTNAHQPIAAIASQLQALPAYWSVSPSLAEQVTSLVNQGYTEIAIVPYFLFVGKITEAIAQEVTQLQQLFPQVKLLLTQPLGPTPSLANLIV